MQQIWKMILTFLPSRIAVPSSIQGQGPFFPSRFKHDQRKVRSQEEDTIQPQYSSVGKVALDGNSGSFKRPF